MNHIHWRPLLFVGIAMAIVVVIVNVAFSAMWAQSSHNGTYSSIPYGPGTMMGPWMWGGMGFFWIFPIVGFFFMLLFFGIIARVFFGAAVPPQTLNCGAYGYLPSVPHTPETCRQCSQPMATNWIVCPYCGTARLPR